MAEAKDDLPLRMTGFMERFNILRNHVKFYNNVGVAATYSVPRPILQSFGDGGIPSLIYAALKETLHHQPILGVTIEDEGTKEPKWRRLVSIDLREVVSVVNADPNANPDKWVQDQHRIPLLCLPELPLWRIVIICQDSALIGTSSQVSFVVGLFGHHGIMDGLSGGAFHLTFLDALNAIISRPTKSLPSADQATIISVPKLPLVPNLEMKATLSVSILYALIQLFKAFVYNPVDKLNWSGPPISADAPRPPISNTRSFALPPAKVKKLVAKCRAEKTSITALIAILIARKLAMMYPDYKRFACTIPFSLRKFTGHSDRDMGCYVSVIEPQFSSEVKPPRGYVSCASLTSEKVFGTNDEKMWESARACKTLIADKASTTHNQIVNMLKFVSDFPSFFLGLIGTKRGHAFEVTNIGVVDGGVGQGDRKATFDRLVFSTSLSTNSDPYCILIATAKNGYMTVAVSWETGVVDDEEAKDVLSVLQSELTRLAEAPYFVKP